MDTVHDKDTKQAYTWCGQKIRFDVCVWVVWCVSEYMHGVNKQVRTCNDIGRGYSRVGTDSVCVCVCVCVGDRV